MIRAFYLGFALVCCGLFSSDAEEEMPPMPPSPVQPFRQWLQMTSEQREKALADYPEIKREVLRRKLEIYEKLPLAERERRLQMLELRFYMHPLMTDSPNSATTRLATVERIPKPLQRVVTERLREWDSLQPEVRRRILTNDAAVNYFVSIPAPPMPPGMESFSAMTTNNPEPLKVVVPTMPEKERTRLLARFNRYFDLPKDDKERVLNTFTEAERQEMQSTLEAFEQLTPEQRRVCINSFDKFTQMSRREQNLFLKNAARWSAMTAQERNTWKALVNDLPPLPEIIPPMPPIPTDREIAQTNR